MTQDEAKRFARDRALSFGESHPMTLCRPTGILWNHFVSIGMALLSPLLAPYHFAEKTLETHNPPKHVMLSVAKNLCLRACSTTSRGPFGKLRAGSSLRSA